MFLRSGIRRKDGKRHRFWSIVENRRVRGNRIVRRQVLHLGEINGSQRAAWSRGIAVFADGEARPKQPAIFPDDRAAPPRRRPAGSISGGRNRTRAVSPETFSFGLRQDKLRRMRRREGHYLLRGKLRDEDPARLWRLYIRLPEIEPAFKELKGGLAIRPIHHQLDHRIEAHIFVAYCLMVTLKRRPRALAPGPTPRILTEQPKTSTAAGRL